MLHINRRPNSLDEMVGNGPTIESLQTMLDNDDKPHTYLLQGPRGCGKTTLARIIAREMGCGNRDIQEVDVAAKENRGIGGAEGLKATVPFKPMFGDIKVYILDEVHMGTVAYFNSLLKTLEEPPSHVYFILCTTDPQNVLNTVRSRCAVYDVEKLNSRAMLRLLQGINESEDIDLSKPHLQKIAEISEGVPREALILVDQVAGMKNKSITKFLDKAKLQEELVIDLCRALLQKKNWKVVVKLLKGVKEDHEKIRWGVLGYMNTVLLGSGNDNAALIIGCFSKPYYDTGKSGLTLSCWEAVNI